MGQTEVWAISVADRCPLEMAPATITSASFPVAISCW
jgi:hypothetical protein